MFRKILIILGSVMGYLFISSVARAEVDAETAYIFNTFLFLVCGFLVMWMAAGFAMLESGLVTSKSVSTIAAKNIGLYSIAGIMFFFVGYNLAYGISPGGFIGTFSPWSDGSALDTGYSDGSDWFFQMVFCATTCSIVSGTLAERIKIWPFFLFAAILSGIIYPIEMGWQWGGGFLAELGFSDFAGSTLVHSAGGSAALAGAIILGARKGRFDTSGNASPMEPFASSSIPLATLGVFVLWLGWFGFNGGSQLALGSFDDSTAVATIFINTNLAACAGVMANAIVTRLIYGKTDVIQMLNGALGGLVAITAEPLAPSPELAMLIGALGGLIVVFGSSLLLKFGIDDVVGAIPVHLFAGIFGTLAVCLSTDVSLTSQIIGILAVNIFVFVISFIIWTIMKNTIGIRISAEAEEKGTDTVEVGVSAYAIRD